MTPDQTARIMFVGIDGEQTVDSKTTLEQIQAIELLECALEHEGERLTWKVLNDPGEPRTIFQSILRDRKQRVDEHTLMADRPSYAVVTAAGNKAVRLEYYEGHDALRLVYDLRSKELQGKKLPFFLTSDPQAYDPVKFLAEAFGIPEDVSKPVLDELHREAKP